MRQSRAGRAVFLALGLGGTLRPSRASRRQIATAERAHRPRADRPYRGHLGREPQLRSSIRDVSGRGGNRGTQWPRNIPRSTTMARCRTPQLDRRRRDADHDGTLLPHLPPAWTLGWPTRSAFPRGSSEPAVPDRAACGRRAAAIPIWPIPRAFPCRHRLRKRPQQFSPSRSRRHPIRSSASCRTRTPQLDRRRRDAHPARVWRPLGQGRGPTRPHTTRTCPSQPACLRSSGRRVSLGPGP